MTHWSARVRPRRSGFLLTETAVALAVLAVAVGLVVELVTWSLAERIKAENRLDALEAATDVLEMARARPWDELTPEWAAGRRLPDHLSARWPDGRLTVRVEPEPGRARVKRVTVDVRRGGDRRAEPVTLTTLFAARSSGGKS